MRETFHLVTDDGLRDQKAFYKFFPNKSNTDRNVVHLFFASKLDAWSRDLNTDFTLGGCLFGAIKLTKNSDSDKYKHSGYGIRFDALSQFWLWNGEWGKNVVIFGVGNSSYCMLIIGQKIS